MLRRIFKMLIILFVIVVAGGFYIFQQFGRTPSKSEVKEYAKLPYFSNGGFVSSQEIKIYPDRVTGGKISFFRFLSKSPNSPKTSFPKVMLDKASFPDSPEQLAAYWMGHSSLILEVNGKRLLVDPVFSNAAPIPGAVGRFDESPLKRKDIPQVDIVLITHNHYDHLERATIKSLKKRDAKFITPLGVGAALRGWGVPKENIHELGWGDSYEQDGLSITAHQTVHYTNRQITDRNKTLWTSYVVESGGKKVYLSGDTGYDENLFKEIGKKYGSFDLAFIEIDGWNPGWPNIHLFPEQVVQIAKEINAKELLPAHWGVFDLALHPWDESIKEVVRIAGENNLKVSTPMMGEKLIPGNTVTKHWWED